MYNIATIAKLGARLGNNSPFWLLLLLILLQWTYRESVLTSDARLHVNPIHFLARRACTNGFSVTQPSLNRSFTIRHAVSLYTSTSSFLHTESASVILYLACGSPGTPARAPSTTFTLLIMDIIKLLYSRDLVF